jgi:hypothetical protein
VSYVIGLKQRARKFTRNATIDVDANTKFYRSMIRHAFHSSSTSETLPREKIKKTNLPAETVKTQEHLGASHPPTPK